jgi:hypothetical protein
VAASATPAVDATLDQATTTVTDTTTTVTDTTTAVTKDALAALQPPTDTSGLLGR